MHKYYFLPPLILQKLIWVPTRLLLSFFGHLEISGLENLKNVKSNVIFACNHSSELDVFLVPASLGFLSKFSPIFYTSRERSFYKNAGWRQRFYGGAFFKAWGAYPVQPGLRDYASSLKNHTQILRDGGNIVIFPEGRTTVDGRIQEAKGGVAHLSYEAKKPIIPVYLGGTFKITIKDFLLGRKKLVIRFGEPIMVSVDSVSYPIPELLKQQARLVMDRVRGLAVSPAPVRVEKGQPVAVPKPA